MGILIPIAIVLVYGLLGYKLGKNYILWGLMGLGIFAGPILLAFLIFSISNSASIVTVAATLGGVASFVFPITIAAIIAVKNNSIFKRQS